MTDELELALRRTLATKAASIGEGDLHLKNLDEARLLVPPPVHAHRPRRLFAAAAVAVVLTGVVGGLVAGREPSGEAPVVVEPASPPAASSSRAWPLTNDTPLPAPAPEDPQTPDLVAGRYLAEVVGLPAGWPLRDLTNQNGTSQVDYVLQDVPGRLMLARADNDAWFVTAATTELMTPSVVAAIGGGIDVALAPGPRTYDGGVKVRLRALAADGTVLDSKEAVAKAGGEPGRRVTVALRWPGAELAAVVRADALDDHDGDPGTPDATIGHWTLGLAVPSATSLPASCDVASGAPVFATAGGPDEVAEAYLRDRFPDYPSPGVRTAGAQTRAGRAFVRWSVDDGIAGGTVFLRRSGEQWEVLGATTDDVDLSQVRIQDGRLVGQVTTSNVNSLYADVVRADQTPVPGSPRPDGQPGAAYRFATAAGPADRSIALDVPVEGETPTLRVGLVGGTILAVAECVVTAER